MSERKKKLALRASKGFIFFLLLFAVEYICFIDALKNKNQDWLGILGASLFFTGILGLSSLLIAVVSWLDISLIKEKITKKIDDVKRKRRLRTRLKRFQHRRRLQYASRLAK